MEYTLSETMHRKSAPVLLELLLVPTSVGAIPSSFILEYIPFSYAVISFIELLI
jgi:hypothetical protein